MKDPYPKVPDPLRVVEVATAVWRGEPAVDQSWDEYAACRGMDTEVFFYSNMSAAKRVCRRCEVREACREAAYASGQEHGVWGETGPGERAAALKAGRHGRREAGK